MDSSEWTLVFFTVISQMAAGLFILQALFVKPEEQNKSLQKTNFSILSCMLLVSVFLSFFHLGNPSNAIRALNNLQSSWLSREVLLISVLTAMSFLQLFLFFSKKLKPAIINILNYAGIIIALLFIFSMAKIYMLEAAPVWNSIYTPLEFFICSFLLGGFLLLILLHTQNFREKHLRKVLPKVNMLFVCLLLLIVFDLANAFYHHYLDFSEPVMNAAEVSYLPAIVRVILLIISLIVTISRYYFFRKKYVLSGFSAIAVAFILLFVAELIGRYFFYASYVRIGV